MYVYQDEKGYLKLVYNWRRNAVRVLQNYDRSSGTFYLFYKKRVNKFTDCMIFTTYPEGNFMRKKLRREGFETKMVKAAYY